MGIEPRNMALRPRELCNLDPRELVKTFQRHTESHGPQNLTSDLLRLLEGDFIPAAVSSIWLTCCKDPDCIVRFVHGTHRLARRDAILTLKKWLRGSRWREMWNSLGGIEGLLRLLAESSLDDVKSLMKSICYSVSVHTPTDSERRHIVTELTTCLFSRSFPTASFQNPDERSLQAVYVQLLPACSTEFCFEALGSDFMQGKVLHQAVWDSGMHLHHGRSIRKAILAGVAEDDTFNRNARRFCAHLLADLPSDSGSLWSESMQFAKDLLGAMFESRITTLDRIRVMPDVILPLLGRLIKRKASAKDMLQVLSLVLEWAQLQPRFVKDFSLRGLVPGYGSFQESVAKLWSRDRETYDSVLRSMLRLMGDCDPSPHYPADLFASVIRPQRYVFLRNLWQYAIKHKFDLKNEHELSQHATEVRDLQLSLVECLEPSDALDLLDRLHQALGFEATILDKSNVLPQNPPCSIESVSGHECVPDFQFLRLKLSSPSTSTTNFARKHIEQLKLAAERGKAPEIRSDYAILAARYSCASQDLETFHDCLSWSQRFDRDPVTCNNLFASNGGPFRGEAMSFLSGINKHQSESFEHLQSSINQTDRTLRHWRRIVQGIFRQPSITQHNKTKAWETLGQVLDDVAAERARGASEVQSRLELNDGTLFDVVFRPILALLLDFQTIELGFEGKDQRFSMGRPVKREWLTTSDVIGQSTWRFVDELAKQTDLLWTRTRRERDPNISRLPKLWPIGLPLWAAIPFEPSKILLAGVHLPYILQRAVSVVFAAGRDACIELPPWGSFGRIPEHPAGDSYHAAFIDQYKLALKLYVWTAELPETIQSRTQKAWTHATNELSLDLDGPEWIAARWNETFSQALGDLFDPQVLSVPAPPSSTELDVWTTRLPAEVDGTTVWNPLNGRPKLTQAATHPTTVIDTMLNVEYGGSYAGIDHERPSHWGYDTRLCLPASQSKAVFDMSRLDNKLRKSAANSEALVAAAILWLDVGEDRPEGILEDGYPKTSNDQLRFPPLVLDSNFRHDDESETDQVMSFLRSYQRRLPSGLLLRLSENAFRRMKTRGREEQQLRRLEEILFRTLKLLAGEPAASQLISDVVAGLPSSSAWHRQVINRRLFKRLKSVQALEFLMTLNNRFSDTSPRRVNNAATSETGETGHVKVTTVKILPSLLNDTELFSTSVAVGHLSSLLASDPHPDVRAFAVSSMLTLMHAALPSNTDKETIKRIEEALLALKRYITALNWRSGNKDPWINWTVENDLPEVVPQERDGSSIFYTMLINAPDYRRSSDDSDPIPTYWQEFIADKILLPTVRDNISNNAVWASRFQEKYATASVRSYTGPVTTTSPDMLAHLLMQMPRKTPKDLFQIQCSRIQLMLLARFDEANDGINFARATAQENDHWASIANSKGSLLTPDTLASIVTMLRAAWDWEVQSGNITLAEVQDAVFDMAATAINKPDDELREWSLVAETLRPDIGVEYFDEMHQRWNDHYGPVVRRIIKRIDSLRTPAWQASSTRQPPQLPDTFTLRSWLWRYPSKPHDDDEDDDENEDALPDLDPLVEDLLSDLRTVISPSKAIYTPERETLRAALDANRGDARKGRLAAKVGNFEAWPAESETEKLIRIDVVTWLIEERIDESQDLDELRAVVEDLVAQWLTEENEEVRTRGYGLRVWMKDAVEGSKGYESSDVEW